MKRLMMRRKKKNNRLMRDTLQEKNSILKSQQNTSSKNRTDEVMNKRTSSYKCLNSKRGNTTSVFVMMFDKTWERPEKSARFLLFQ